MTYLAAIRFAQCQVSEALYALPVYALTVHLVPAMRASCSA